MKRQDKQIAKQSSIKTTQTTAKPTLNQQKPAPKASNLSASVKSAKDSKIFGSTSYKRPQLEPSYSVSSLKNTVK